MKTEEIQEIYSKLFGCYGNLNWWPADSPYEIMVGAILTQNTAWSNVEKALANFNDKLSPEHIENIAIEDLIQTIRPSGFFNQKAVYLKELTVWYKKYNYSVEEVQKQKLPGLQTELLSVKGIGPETADSILLYAFDFPTFVVDAYTKRLLERLGLNVKTDYNSIKALFEENLPRDSAVYNNYHALIVKNAKEHCKTKPKCNRCPLEEECKFA